VAETLSHSTVLGTSRTGQMLNVAESGKLWLEKAPTVIASCPSTHCGFTFAFGLINRLRAKWIPEEDIVKVTDEEGVCLQSLPPAVEKSEFQQSKFNTMSML
jgi:hypothetical protein